MFVIQTTPTKEYIAKFQIEKAGFICYLPRQVKKRKTRGKILKEYEKILFPSYLFIDSSHLTDREYYKIKDSYYVHKFIGSLKTIEEKYIKFLANGGNPLAEIKIYFDEFGKAKIINDKNNLAGKIVGINRRDKKARINIEIANETKTIILNYEEVKK